MFWPDEDCYSEVAESKMLECKEPSVGQTVKVKEGCKIFDGIIDAIGSKSKIEQRLCEIESQTTDTAADDEAPVTSKSGKPTLHAVGTVA